MDEVVNETIDWITEFATETFPGMALPPREQTQAQLRAAVDALAEQDSPEGFMAGYQALAGEIGEEEAARQLGLRVGRTTRREGGTQ